MLWIAVRFSIFCFTYFSPISVSCLYSERSARIMWHLSTPFCLSFALFTRFFFYFIFKLLVEIFTRNRSLRPTILYTINNSLVISVCSCFCFVNLKRKQLFSFFFFFFWNRIGGISLSMVFFLSVCSYLYSCVLCCYGFVFYSGVSIQNCTSLPSLGYVEQWSCAVCTWFVQNTVLCFTLNLIFDTFVCFICSSFLKR